MAIITNELVTYDMVGIREDLSDIIKNIAPVDTLFYSSLSEGGAAQRKVEWQTDTLGAAAANAHVEGDEEDSSYTALTEPVRVYNNCQIQKKKFVISNTTEKVKTAGRVSEKDYQTAKKAKELAKDVEYAFLKEVRVDGAAATAPKLRGIINWITTNLNKAADATLQSDGTVTGGTARDLTDTIFKSVLQNIFNAGGNPSLVYCDASLKQVISGFAHESGKLYQTLIEQKKLTTAINVYESDFGTLSIKIHRGMPSGVLIILDTAHIGKKATLRNTHRERLAITGDSQKWVMRVEHSLRDLTELAHGRITNLN